MSDLRKWFGNVAEFEQGQNRCCQHDMTKQTESRCCCIQPTPSREDGTASLCFALITTCNILYFVFDLTCKLLALSLTSSHVCQCGLAVAALAMLQQCRGYNVCMHPDVTVSYVHYIACVNNLRSSIGGTCMSYI